MTTQARPLKRSIGRPPSDSDRIADWISSRLRELAEDRPGRGDPEASRLDESILRMIQRDEAKGGG